MNMNLYPKQIRDKIIRQERKERIKNLLCVGIFVSVIAAVGIIQTQVPKINKEA